MIGVIVYTLYALGSFTWFRSRLSLDGCTSLFELANFDQMHLPIDRYALGLNQFLPWLGAQFDLSLHSLATLYLCNDVLWFVGFFLLFMFYFKEPTYALAMVVGHVLLLQQQYFLLLYTLSLSWPLVLLAVLLLNRMRVKGFMPLPFLVLLVCSWYIVHSHELMILAYLLILSLLALNRPLIRNAAWFWGYVLLLVLGTSWRMAHLPEYDQSFISDIGFDNGVEHWFVQVKNLVYYYPIFLMLLGSGLVLAFRQQKIVWANLIFWLGLLAYSLVINWVYPGVAMNKELLPVLYTLCVWLFIMHADNLMSWRPKPALRAILPMALCLALCWKGYTWYQHFARPVLDKVSMIRKQLSKLDRGGTYYFEVDSTKHYQTTFMPVEGIVWSALKGPEYTRILYPLDSIPEGISNKRIGRRIDSAMQLNDLNPDYFIIKHSCRELNLEFPE